MLHVFAMALAILSVAAEAQTSELQGPGQQAASDQGKLLFESSCAVCHGLDGGGGEHAPNIGRGSYARSMPDSDLSKIVHDGIASKGMPSFSSLGNLNISELISYLRSLQGKKEAEPVSGNALLGKQLFWGKARCADCHVLSGEGRFVSTDLSDYAYEHSANDVRSAILNPEQQEWPRQTVARVTTNSGKQLSGIIRNESNASLQLQQSDGNFASFLKAELRSIDRSPAPSMPGDYRERLSPTEIDDLVNYIVSQSSTSDSTSQAAVRQEQKKQTD